MVKANMTNALLSNIDVRQGKNGNGYTLLTLKQKVKRFGEEGEFVAAEVFVPKNILPEVPATGSIVNAVLELNSREYNGKYYYGFTLSGIVLADGTVHAKPSQQEIQASIEKAFVDDDIPF